MKTQHRSKSLSEWLSYQSSYALQTTYSTNMKTTHKISEYINRNAERKNAHWKIRGESKMFMHDGMWYDASDFDKILALYEYVKFNDKGENQDKTRIK